MQENHLLPTTETNRIISLDILRGIAVLGILIMNIQSFSMPSAAYINPTAYGDLQGINKWIWIFSHLLASEKFMAIFSILFGAGVLLFSENAESKGYNSAALHYKRMGWLLLFGLIHAYLLWYGDILFKYSLCGMLIFLFRNMHPRRLVWLGFGFFLVPLALNNLLALSIPYWPEESVESTLFSWKPGQEAISHQIDSMRGSWPDRMGIRVPAAVFMHTGYFLMGSFWRIMSMMLLGMALFKWKVLSAELSYRFYTQMIVIGFLLGFALSGLGVFLNFRDGWTMEFSMFRGNQFNYLGSVGVAFGYIGLVMLSSKIAQAASQTVVPSMPRLPNRSLPKTSATPQTEPRTRIIKMFFVVITAASNSSDPWTGDSETRRREMVEPNAFNISFGETNRGSLGKRLQESRSDRFVYLGRIVG